MGNKTVLLAVILLVIAICLAFIAYAYSEANSDDSSIEVTPGYYDEDGVFHASYNMGGTISSRGESDGSAISLSLYALSGICALSGIITFILGRKQK